MVLRIVLGLVMTAAAAVAGGPPAVVAGPFGPVGAAGAGAGRRRAHPSERDAEVQATEVFGQRKLLKWTVPGLAHFARRSGASSF